MQPKIASIIGALSLSALAACGGGDSTAVETPNSGALTPQSFETSLNSPSLSGMRVVSCSPAGTGCTDKVSADGKFTQVRNGTLNFMVGDLLVMTAYQTGEPITSVLAFSPSGSSDNATFLNQMALLYTLDKDGNPDNGISLGSTVNTALKDWPNASAVNFSVSAEEFAANPAVQELINLVAQASEVPATSLRSAADVKVTLDQIEFARVWAGTWTLTLDDAAGTKHTVLVDKSGKATVNSVTFNLDTTATSQQPIRFHDATIGSFIGTLKSDGSGKGTWSRMGTSAQAGFWTAKRS